MRLTGRRRHRIHTRLFRRPILVLQVELEWREFCQFRGERVTKLMWRDAGAEDLMMIESCHTPFPVYKPAEPWLRVN